MGVMLMLQMMGNAFFIQQCIWKKKLNVYTHGLFWNLREDLELWPADWQFSLSEDKKQYNNLWRKYEVL